MSGGAGLTLSKSALQKKAKHSKEEEKGLTFDRLEDKLNDELSSMNVKDKEGKAEMKYTPGVQTERVTALSRGKTKSATAIIQKEKHLKAENRSNSLEKQGGEMVSCNSLPTSLHLQGFGLFEAANVMCNIVEISKDSTMHRRTHETYAAATPHQHQKPTKVNSKCE
ncbi:hypothetical protein ANCCAN_18114 [Ancylostoma caninum]|uniref:Uncharacterized protein n=1 Tax=Ancylostoma caninum TaxID=29170 RepID=A0A368FWY5_ANCCA|nr:hypothetical protein ANCCAN_18114 [Ancylostoma caninum]